MKILHVYRSEPDATTKKLVEIVSRDRDVDSFNLNVDAPDYAQLIAKLEAADKAITWW